MSDGAYRFKENYFEESRAAVWRDIFARWKPKLVLEIGSFEGQSTCFTIEEIAKYAEPEIHCIDTWQGGEEHQAQDMTQIEQNFRHNVTLATAKTGGKAKVNVLKGTSEEHLPGLYLTGYKNAFDLVYIDGSHQAPDVLFDLVLAYRLTKIGGIMICDDYVWRMGGEVLREPKIAIDSFTNIHRDSVMMMVAPLHQVYLYKTK